MRQRGKGGFPEPRGIVNVVCIGRWMYKANTFLEISCFPDFLWWPFFLVCTISPVLFSPAVHTGHGHAQSAISWKGNTFKWLSGNGNSLHQTRAPSKEGTLWFLWPKYRSLAVQKTTFDFLSKVTIVLGAFMDLMIQWNHENSKLWFEVFVKWHLCPDCTN